MIEAKHIPVLLKESIDILDPRPGEFFIDATIGAGGHSEKILEKIGSSGKLLGIDWDENNIQNLKIKNPAEHINKFMCSVSRPLPLKKWQNAILVQGNYAEKLSKNNIMADGLIADLGFSSDQLESGKGFSFLKNEPLDMRYGNTGPTAAEVVNSFNEKDLADIIFRYGEERFSRRIAKKIVEERKKKRILTTMQLAEIVKNAAGKNYEKGRINPATRTFQALRIYVNHELENLETLLKNLPMILRPVGLHLAEGGRAAIISFHSLEDRLVKNYFKDLAKKGRAKILTKKPIMASAEELKINPRARSAKLRGIQMI